MGNKNSGGRNKLPPELHALRGSWREDRHGTMPKFEKGKPPRCPRNLSKDAKWLWDHMAKHKRDWLQPDDLPMLLQLCLLWDRLCVAMERAKEDPFDRETINAVRLYNSEWTKIAYRFGLSPLDRASLPQIKEEADKTAERYFA